MLPPRQPHELGPFNRKPLVRKRHSLEAALGAGVDLVIESASALGGKRMRKRGRVAVREGARLEAAPVRA